MRLPGFVFDKKGFELKMSAHCELFHKPLSLGGKSSDFLLECEAVTTTGVVVIVVFAKKGSYQIVYGFVTFSFFYFEPHLTGI